MSCYIDDCREDATYFVHSFPDDVRLCDGHRFLHPVEQFETLCVGPARCAICRSAPVAESVRGTTEKGADE